MDGLEKMLAKVSSMPDIRLQSFIQSILAWCLAKSSDNMVKISSIDNRNYVAASTYMKMPRVRACKSASSARSKIMYVKDKANVINTFVDSIMYTISEHGKEMTYCVLCKVSDD